MLLSCSLRFSIEISCVSYLFLLIFSNSFWRISIPWLCMICFADSWSLSSTTVEHKFWSMFFRLQWRLPRWSFRHGQLVWRWNRSMWSFTSSCLVIHDFIFIVNRDASLVTALCIYYSTSLYYLLYKIMYILA